MVLRALVAVIALLPISAAAVPIPPCGFEPEPAFGGVDDAPRARIWTAEELSRDDWRAADCLQWTGKTKLVVAVASRFHASDNVFDRQIDVSAWPSVKYWSTTKQKWRPLVVAVSVIDATGSFSRDGSTRLSAGHDRLFVERDEYTGNTTYRMRTLEHSDSRLVVSVENVTPIKLAILTVFEPRALQTVTFVEREKSSGIWSTYQITRVASGSSSIALGYKGSFLNRLEAIRRYLAGQPTDQEPPLAPH